MEPSTQENTQHNAASQYQAKQIPNSVAEKNKHQRFTIHGNEAEKEANGGRYRTSQLKKGIKLMIPMTANLESVESIPEPSSSFVST